MTLLIFVAGLVSVLITYGSCIAGSNADDVEERYWRKKDGDKTGNNG